MTGSQDSRLRCVGTPITLQGPSGTHTLSPCMPTPSAKALPGHCHLLELGLGVDVDLAHLAVKCLILDVDAALVPDPLGLVPCPGKQLAPASPQLGAVTFQH